MPLHWNCALIAMGCTVCQRCYTGKCPWGIATSDPWISKRINPDIAQTIGEFAASWSLEIKDMMGGRHKRPKVYAATA
jgi:glutamate synthase domain-containing protein 2